MPQTQPGRGKPGQCLTQAQASVSGWTQGKTQLHSANPDHIAVAQEGLLNRFAIDGGEDLGLGGEDEAFGRMEIQVKVLVPNAIFVHTEVAGTRSADAYRKTAGDPFGARLLAIKNCQVDHYQS